MGKIFMNKVLYYIFFRIKILCFSIPLAYTAREICFEKIKLFHTVFSRIL